MKKGNLEQDIIDYYESCQRDYELVWHLKSRMSMHYGYWDSSTKRLPQSLTNMNVKLADMAKINKNDLVLDAGCGVGGSSIFLAKNIGCRVKGITLSKMQVETAQKNAIIHDAADKTEFEINNYTATGYPDESFDVVWAIESVCHVAEKSDFLKEAHRILKKGGRLILADFFSNSMNHAADPKNMLSKWAATWAVPEFEYHKTFIEKGHLAGFKNVTDYDATKNITPSAIRLYFAFYPGSVVHYYLKIRGKRNAWNDANLWSPFYQYHSLMRKMWSYHIVLAVKE